jgi:hypothetical protein
VENCGIFISICNILKSFGQILWTFGIFCNHLVYFTPFWKNLATVPELLGLLRYLSSCSRSLGTKLHTWVKIPCDKLTSAPHVVFFFLIPNSPPGTNVYYFLHIFAEKMEQIHRSDFDLKIRTANLRHKVDPNMVFMKNNHFFAIK